MAGLFLSRALLKILAEKEVKQKQHTNLRLACEAALEEINKENAQAQGASSSGSHAVGPDTPMPPPQEQDRFVNADKYFTPFRLACESKSPRIIRTALDCLQKLMAYGHLTGTMLAEVEGFPDASRLIELIVDTIRGCFIGEQTDEGVQLQIIKALLTAVTTPSCDVHEGTLLKAVRTCFSVYLASRSIVNQTTAKATLTQMLSVIFQRMEALGMPNSTTSSSAATTASGTASITVIAPGGEVAAIANAIGVTIPIPETPLNHAHAHAHVGEHATGDDSPQTDAHSVVDSAAGTDGEANSEAHTDLHDLPDNHQQEATEAAPLDDVAAINAVVTDLVNDIIAEVTGEVSAPPATNLSHIPSDSLENIATDTTTSSSTNAHSAAQPRETEEDAKDEQFGHVHRKDAYLVLRSICKLALKDIPDRDPHDRSSPELRSKLLSLDLQLMIVENAGPVLSNDPLFIEPIKQYLCTSLMKNGGSHVPEVFERTVSIFLVLLSRFKTHLKSQIDVFFKEILLNVLEINSSSFAHKWTVMQALHKVCQNKQTLMDLYVNFDCEELLTNIFERMVNDLSKAAQGRPSSEINGTPVQELNLKVKGLECLVCTMRCFEELCAPLEKQLNEEMTPKQESDDSPMSHSTSAALLSPVRDTTQLLQSQQPSQATLSGDGISSPVSETVEFENRKVKKEQRERCIELFNRHPTKGIKALQDHGFLTHTTTDVASFLHSEPRLNRSAIGEYLGERDDFCISVMHDYIDQVDFKTTLLGNGIPFLEALRVFLSCFKLPGESQKIDRMMLKFAQRYCAIHPENGVFASADAAYVLAYSVIMLNTDLHNTQVKRKITKDGFVRMTRGINDNSDLPKQFVESIFDDISKNELHLDAVDSADGGSKVHSQRFTFTSATDLEHVRPMFKLVWRPMLAALTVTLKSQSDPVVVAICLEGLQISIHVACLFMMSTERDSFLKALVNFTNLPVQVELKAKNIEAIKALLSCAVREGNYLGDEWRDILFCVSHLEHAQLLGGQHTNVNKRKTDAITDASSMSIVLAVDKVFTLTRRLNVDALVDFVKALCAISNDELHASPPRMYSLAKLVDVAYYNMERVRLEWSKVWAVMGEFFNKVGLMSNTDIASFAVDSLRQLSMKFLEKGELANYSFQKDFLRPFEHIMEHKTSKIRELVTMCVAQMVQAKSSNIRSGWINVFSVFSQAASDSDQNIVDLAFSNTVRVFDNCFSNDHDSRVIVISSSFVAAINCMAEFACNAYFPEVSMEAIRQLRICATHVATTPELFVSPEEPQHEEPKIWVKGWFPVLFGLSRIIDRCKLDVRTRALTVMFEIMKVYGTHFLVQWWVDLFRVIFRIFDDKKLQTLHTDQDRAAWLSTTCTHALRSTVDVLTQYFSLLQPVLMGEMFSLLERCICDSSNEHLGRAGTECLHIMVMSNGTQFTPDSWERFCNHMHVLFDRTSPKELLTYGQDAGPGDIVPHEESNGTPTSHTTSTSTHTHRGASQELSNYIIMKCVTQLELIQTLEWILLSSTQPETADSRTSTAKMVFPKDSDSNTQRQFARSMMQAKHVDRAGELFVFLSAPQLLGLLDCLQHSHDFALKFNSNNELRNRLYRLGFMKNRTKPNLFRQEIASIGVALRIMFRIYHAETRKDCWDAIEQRIQTACGSVLHQFAYELPKEGRDSWAQNVSLIFRELLALNDERFAHHASLHYAAIAEVTSLSFDGGLGDISFYLSDFFLRSRSFKL